MIHYEPYTAGFTGTLTSIVLADKRTFTIRKNFPKVKKGDPFMLKIDEGNVVMLPVLVPPYWVGMREAP